MNQRLRVVLGPVSGRQRSDPAKPKPELMVTVKVEAPKLKAAFGYAVLNRGEGKWYWQPAQGKRLLIEAGDRICWTARKYGPPKVCRGEVIFVSEYKLTAQRASMSPEDVRFADIMDFRKQRPEDTARGQIQLNLGMLQKVVAVGAAIKGGAEILHFIADHLPPGIHLMRNASASAAWTPAQQSGVIRVGNLNFVIDAQAGRAKVVARKQLLRLIDQATGTGARTRLASPAASPFKGFPFGQR